jgi:hypothetical protein
MSRLVLLGECTNPRASVSLAFRIAIRFPTHAPSAKQIMEAFPEVTRATAYRYARDYHAARQLKAA